MPWPPRVAPPYDVVVLGATPMDELRKHLQVFAQLFRSLGRPGTRVFLEDQSLINVPVVGQPAKPADPEVLAQQATAWSPAADSSLEWVGHGLSLYDAFDPCTRGFWPMPHGRIYALMVL